MEEANPWSQWSQVVAVLGANDNPSSNISIGWSSGAEKNVEYDEFCRVESVFLKNYNTRSGNSGLAFASIAHLHVRDGNLNSSSARNENVLKRLENVPLKLTEAAQEIRKLLQFLPSGSGHFVEVRMSTFVNEPPEDRASFPKYQSFDTLCKGLASFPNIAGMIKVVETIVGVEEGKPATAIVPRDWPPPKRVEILMKKGEGIVVDGHHILTKKIPDFRAKLDEIFPALQDIYNENYELLKSQNGIVAEFVFFVKLQVI